MIDALKSATAHQWQRLIDEARDEQTWICGKCGAVKVRHPEHWSSYSSRPVLGSFIYFLKDGTRLDAVPFCSLKVDTDVVKA